MKSDKIEVTWEVDDGYAGPSRPQSTVVDLEDFEDLSEQAIEVLLYEIVGEDFSQNIGYSITSAAVSDIQEAIKAKEKP